MDPLAAIGLDVGANRIKAVVVENDGTTLEQIIRSTQPEAWMKQVADLVNELLPMCGRGILNCAGKVPGLEGLNWRKWLCWEKPIPGDSRSGGRNCCSRRKLVESAQTETWSMGMATRRLQGGDGSPTGPQVVPRNYLHLRNKAD